VIPTRHAGATVSGQLRERDDGGAHGVHFAALQHAVAPVPRVAQPAAGLVADADERRASGQRARRAARGAGDGGPLVDRRGAPAPSTICGTRSWTGAAGAVTSKIERPSVPAAANPR